METWSFPNASPISCNDCPTFQRPHMSALCIAESLTRLDCVINTTFREKIYSRWCCIDRLSWHGLSECGFLPSQKLILSCKANPTVVSYFGFGAVRSLLFDEGAMATS